MSRKMQARNKENEGSKALHRVVREQRKLIESLKREIARLQKELNRKAGIFEEDEPEEPEFSLKKPEPGKCPECGKGKIKTVESNIGNRSFEFKICQHCGYREKINITKK